MNMMSTSPPDAPAAPSPLVPAEPPAKPSMWARLGRFSFRRRRYVLGAWITVLVAVFALVGTIGASSDSSFSIPDSESKSGFDTLDAYFGGLGSGRTV